MTAIRSVPFLIYGLIFIRVCGPGSFTGVLTLAVCSVGLLCKRFTEAIDTLDFRAYHALEAMGTPKLSATRLCRSWCLSSSPPGSIGLTSISARPPPLAWPVRAESARR